MQFILIHGTYNLHIHIHAEKHTIDKHTQRNKLFTQKNTRIETHSLTQTQSTTLLTDIQALIHKLHIFIQLLLSGALGVQTERESV